MNLQRGLSPKLRPTFWPNALYCSLCSSLPLLAAPARAASAWGEPWGSFTWFAAVPVPATGIWALAFIAVVMALMGASRFK